MYIFINDSHGGSFANVHFYIGVHFLVLFLTGIVRVIRVLGLLRNSTLLSDWRFSSGWWDALRRSGRTLLLRGVWWERDLKLVWTGLGFGQQVGLSWVWRILVCLGLSYGCLLVRESNVAVWLVWLGGYVLVACLKLFLLIRFLGLKDIFLTLNCMSFLKISLLYYCWSWWFFELFLARRLEFYWAIFNQLDFMRTDVTTFLFICFSLLSL